MEFEKSEIKEMELSNYKYCDALFLWGETERTLKVQLFNLLLCAVVCSYVLPIFDPKHLESRRTPWLN